MYKTIRHGENSLQYTILPQNDDFRLEGKIKSAGSKKSKNKKPRRRSFFAYLGLLFVCTVIVGAVLVPFLVSAGLPNPTEWFQKTKAAFSRVSMPSSSTVTNKEHKENGPINSQHTGSALANAMLNKGNLMALNKANVGKPVKIINKDGVEKIILKLNKTSLQAADANLENKEITMAPMPESAIGTTLKEDSNQKITIHDLGDMTNQPITTVQPQLIKQETTSKPMATTATAEVVLASTTSPALNRSIILNSVPNVPRASLQSSLNQSNNSTSSSSSSSSSTQPTMTTRIMQVPLLKSTAKKPAIPPVLVKNLSPIQPTPETNNYNNNNNLNDIIPSKTLTANNKNGNLNTMTASTTTGQDSDWIHTHWAYIDPSTYFQWNGYKTEDSVLLPALLGFALIGVILIITVCLVARNKRTIVTSVRKRNRNHIEETGGEDNTTLLTNTNLSDED